MPLDELLAWIPQGDPDAALARLPAFPEWMDEGYRAKNVWPSFADALRRLHTPEGEADVAPSAPAAHSMETSIDFFSPYLMALVRRLVRT